MKIEVNKGGRSESKRLFYERWEGGAQLGVPLAQFFERRGPLDEIGRGVLRETDDGDAPSGDDGRHGERPERHAEDGGGLHLDEEPRDDEPRVSRRA